MAWTDPSTINFNTGQVITETKLEQVTADLTDLKGPFYNSGALGSAQASISATSIPSGYGMLRALLLCRGDTAADQTSVLLQFNSDTGNNYTYIGNEDYGAFSSGGINYTTTTSSILVGRMSANTGTANRASVLDIRIPFYDQTTFHKSVVSQWTNSDSAGDGNAGAGMSGGIWASTSAITSLTVLPGAGNFAVGSHLRVYTLG